MSQLTFRDGPEHSPSFSPDGDKLVFLGFEDKKMGYHNSVVSLMDLADGSIENLTSNLDRSVNSVRWTGSSTQLMISYDDFGKKNIATLSLAGDVQVLV